MYRYPFMTLNVAFCYLFIILHVLYFVHTCIAIRSSFCMFFILCTHVSLPVHHFACSLYCVLMYCYLVIILHVLYIVPICVLIYSSYYMFFIYCAHRLLFIHFACSLFIVHKGIMYFFRFSPISHKGVAL